MNTLQDLELIEASTNKTANKLSSIGKVLISITGGIAAGLTILCVPFITPALRKVCLPYVPATTTQIQNILLALKGRSGKLIDLGSGDGRIVIETAKHEFLSHGVELNPWLVLYSKLDAFRKGYGSTTRFYCKDLWKFSISPYENIVIFGVKEMMSDLERKIHQECYNGCSIIACRFPLPNLVPKRIIGTGVDTVWVYKVEK